MTKLDPRARALIDSVREDHEPSAEDLAEARASLERRLGAAAFVLPALGAKAIGGSTAPLVAKAAVAKSVAAKATTKAAVAASAAKGTVVGFLFAKPLLLAVGATLTAGAAWTALEAVRPESVATTPSTVAVVSTAAKPHVAQRQTSNEKPAPPAAGLPLDIPSPPPPVPEPLVPVMALPVPVVAASPLTSPTHPSQVRGSAPVPASPAVSGVAAREPINATRSTLGDEARLLSEVFAAMKADQPDRALALLDEHTARYPSGGMRAEASAERVLAYCDLGRHDDARAEASRFLQSFASAPIAVRVRSSCAFER